MKRRERAAVVLVTLLGAASRLFAIAKTPWDWDELLFMLGMREFDVAVHHPHPPGFPLYIGLGRIVRLIVGDDFRALQSINVIAAMAIVPAAYFFCRALRLPFATSLSAATILAFLPNVWFFGGTAFSDVPSMVLSMLACGLFLRRTPAAYLGGAIVLAVAIGFRPQNLVIAAVPLLIATIDQLRGGRWGIVVIGFIVAAFIAGGSYAIAIMGTGGWARYASALAKHREYITRMDSFASAVRPSLLAVADDFFFRPFRNAPVNVAIALISAVSVVAAIARRYKPVLIAMATFLPFWIMAWLTLDFHSTSRFSIAWMPLTAIFVAHGISVLGRERSSFVLALTAFLAGVMIAWTLPALAVIRHVPSPPVQAVAYFERSGAKVYAHTSMAPYFAYFRGDSDIAPAPPLARFSSGPAFFVTERPIEGVWRRFAYEPRGPLWNLVRQRYFTVSAIPVTTRPQFGAGWYDEESDRHSNWIWMATRGEVSLPATTRAARVFLRLGVPQGAASTVTISLNGKSIDRIKSQSAFEREYDVPTSQTNVLTIETDRTVAPQTGDPRALGVRIDALELFYLN